MVLRPIHRDKKGRDEWATGSPFWKGQKDRRVSEWALAN